MKNVKSDDEQRKAEKQFLMSNNPFTSFHRPESDSEQQYDGHTPQPVSKQKTAADDSVCCCPCILF